MSQSTSDLWNQCTWPTTIFPSFIIAVQHVAGLLLCPFLWKASLDWKVCSVVYLIFLPMERGTKSKYRCKSCFMLWVSTNTSLVAVHNTWNMGSTPYSIYICCTPKVPGSNFNWYNILIALISPRRVPEPHSNNSIQVEMYFLPPLCASDFDDLFLRQIRDIV
jgi:hypothetical protein